MQSKRIERKPTHHCANEKKRIISSFVDNQNVVFPSSHKNEKKTDAIKKSEEKLSRHKIGLKEHDLEIHQKIGSSTSKYSPSLLVDISNEGDMYDKQYNQKGKEEIENDMGELGNFQSKQNLKLGIIDKTEIIKEKQNSNGIVDQQPVVKILRKINDTYTAIISSYNNNRMENFVSRAIGNVTYNKDDVRIFTFYLIYIKRIIK